MRPLRYLNAYVALGGVYVGFIVFECLTPHPLPLNGPPDSDKWLHLATFGLMMAWFGQLSRERRQRAVLALAFMALGGGIELARGFMALGRTAEWGDFGADCLGVWMGHWATRQGGGALLASLEAKLLKRG
jgi:VanZ family protein